MCPPKGWGNSIIACVSRWFSLVNIKNNSQMIQANELRIGNLIKEALLGEIIVTPSVLQDLLHGAENYEPILLTEEWLIKFGFKKSEENYGYKVLQLNNYIQLKTNSEGNVSGNLFLSKLRIECKYVHQLQNLYFPLKGVELSEF